MLRGIEGQFGGSPWTMGTIEGCIPSGIGGLKPADAAHARCWDTGDDFSETAHVESSPSDSHDEVLRVPVPSNWKMANSPPSVGKLVALFKGPSIFRKCASCIWRS
mmetsp:Transcript_113647/g.226151  ORF Transcript_113647/g.226151 Transcript_113647/m.226151 type:complete len:106 (-) Transcript_113647:401-718(-)